MFQKIYFDPALPANAKAVYVALALRADSTTRVAKWTTHEKLHELTGLSVSTVQRGLEIAEELGLITKKRTGNANLYRVHDFNSATPYVPSQTVDNSVDNSEVNPAGIHSDSGETPKDSGNPPETLPIGHADRSDRSHRTIGSVPVTDIQDSVQDSPQETLTSSDASSSAGRSNRGFDRDEVKIFLPKKLKGHRRDGEVLRHLVKSAIGAINGMGLTPDAQAADGIGRKLRELVGDGATQSELVALVERWVRLAGTDHKGCGWLAS